MAFNRYIPINLRLPEKLIKESDQLAEEEGSSRSEIVRNALRAYIERRRKLQAAYAIVERRGREAGIKSQEDLDRVLDEVRTKRRIQQK